MEIPKWNTRMLWDKSNFNYDFNPIDYIIVYVFSFNCCIVKIVKRKIMKMWMWKLPTWVILLLRKTSENTRQADNSVWINKHKYIIIPIYTISNSNQAMSEFENMSYTQNSFFCSCPFISFIQQKIFHHHCIPFVLLHRKSAANIRKFPL